MNATLTPEDFAALAAIINTGKKKFSAEFLESWAIAKAEYDTTGANIILSKGAAK